MLAVLNISHHAFFRVSPRHATMSEVITLTLGIAGVTRVVYTNFSQHSQRSSILLCYVCSITTGMVVYFSSVTVGARSQVPTAWCHIYQPIRLQISNISNGNNTIFQNVRIGSHYSSPQFPLYV